MIPKLSLVLISTMISADVNDCIKMGCDDFDDLYEFSEDYYKNLDKRRISFNMTKRSWRLGSTRVNNYST